DTIKEKPVPSWATFNPDTSKVFFAKNYNLYWMDCENYKKALKDEKDSTIVEHQFTTDGVQYYAWGGDRYSVTTQSKKDQELEEEKGKSVRLNWYPDGRHFVLSRNDNRDYSDLWVINNVWRKRAILETDKYLKPGEPHSTDVELHLFD